MSLTFNEYQVLAHRTSGQDEPSKMLNMAAMGISGESGELLEATVELIITTARISDTIKKHIFHDHPLETMHLVKELGGVLWYMAEMCSALEINFNFVAETNIAELRTRYPEGFSSERSINRSKE